MALHVLAYNLTRVINIMGVQPLMAAMRVVATSRRPAKLPLHSQPGPPKL